jgi:rare lipoprotein A
MDKQITSLLPFAIVVQLAVAQPSQNASSIGHTQHSHHNSKVRYGTASFYANKFEGRKTANGEVFHQKKMTAASNQISLNTFVKVTNLRNKKSAIVKITDRMHPHNKRLIDLSRSAALQLGYTGRGLARVKIELLGRRQPPDWRIDPTSGY